jgi:hypothetical protein
MKKIIFSLLLAIGLASGAYSQCPADLYTAYGCNGQAIFYLNGSFFGTWQVVSIDSDFGDLTTAHDSMSVDTVMAIHTYAANGTYYVSFDLAFYDTLSPGTPCVTNVSDSIYITNITGPVSTCNATFTPTQYCMDSVHFEPDYGLYPCTDLVAAGSAVTNLGDTLSSSFGFLTSYTPWPSNLTFYYSYSNMGTPYLQCSTTVSVPALNTYQLDLFADTSAMPLVVLHDTSSTNMLFTDVNWGDGYTSTNIFQETFYHSYLIDGTYSISANAIPANMYNYVLSDSNSVTCYTSDMMNIDIQGASNALSCNLAPAVTYDLTTQTLDFGLTNLGPPVTSSNLDVSWSFDNGMSSLLDFGTIDSILTAPTSFTVNYTIYDFNHNQTCINSVTNSINNIYPACNALVYIYEDSITPGIFWADDQSSGGLAPYTYVWDFGDGDTSSLHYPTHTYVVPGIYNICLTITDSQVPPCMSTYCDTADARAFSPMSQFNVVDPNSVGLNENTLNDFSLFPNPASDYLVLNAGENYGENIVISIYNIAGQMIESKRYQNGNLRVDVSNLSSGVFFLKVEDGIKSATRKFIKR